jgi:protein CpxP
MRRAAVLIAALLACSPAFAFGGAPAFADSGPGGPPMHGHWRHHHDQEWCGHARGPMARWAEELELTEKQEHAIRGIFQENQAAFRPLMDKYFAERRDMRALTVADKIDEPAIRRQATRLASTEADLAMQRAKMSSKIRAVLTPAQVKKFQEIQARRDRRIDRFRERRGERFDGANPGGAAPPEK